ncbi:MAG: mechanosensitive ion channel [Candidatus Nanoarchaeia archaeon]|jgi:small-conductance mechanosensitive channel|nr:mechanosensitive ion channel [Candidatus Nanoarchaeia archaeon]|tara:strand:- start:399 stop:944 length:546 start_codon:yes stop_codon:yes gene_type:complete
MVNLSLFDLNAQNIIIKLITAIIILLIGFVVARILSNLTKKVLHELETNKILKGQAGVKIQIEEFSSSIIKYIIYFIAIIMALNQLGLTTTLLYILLTIILVILVGFIILAFKDFIPNIVAGFMIHQKDKIKSGDKIKVKDIEGKVVHVNLVETRIITKKKDTVYIPNSMLTKNEVIILKK